MGNICLTPEPHIPKPEPQSHWHMSRVGGLVGLKSRGADISCFVACGRVRRAGRPPTLTAQTVPRLNGTDGHHRRKFPLNAKANGSAPAGDGTVPAGDLIYFETEESFYKVPLLPVPRIELDCMQKHTV
jgi:hypothetical protein